MAAAKSTPEEQREKARERHRRWAAKNPNYDRERYANNPERRAKNRESAQKSRENNPEKHAAYQREYAVAHCDTKRRVAREWREANPERVRASDRERYANNPERRARAKTWLKEHPEAARQYGATRRARERDSFVEPVCSLVVLERDDGICGICREDVDPLDFHVDHVIPLSRGGTHEYANVQVAHPVCNLRKWAHVGF